MKRLLAIPIIFLATLSFAAKQSVSTVPEGPTKGNVRTVINSNFSKLDANDVELYNFQGPWITGKVYAEGVFVSYLKNIYVCMANHTAGTFATDLAAVRWKFWGSDLYATINHTHAIDDLTDVDTTGKATGKILKFNSSGNLIVADDEIGAAGTGDITGVTAGTGLTGGGDTGAVTVGLSTATQDTLAGKLDKSGGAMTGTLSMGVASTTTGIQNFYNSGAAYPTGLYSPGAASPSVGLRLPGTMPTGNSFVSVDTNGYLGFTLLSDYQTVLTNPLTQSDIDDTPSDGNTTQPASSNSVYDGLALKLDKSGGTLTGTLTAPAFESSAADGSHYIATPNTVTLTSTATLGRAAWLTDRWWLANGTNWTTRYLLDSSFIGSVVQAYDADLDGWAGISPTAGNIATTGTISGAIVTATDADAHTLTAAEYHGGSVLATGAGIYTLPAAAAGLSGCVEAGQGVTAIIQLLPGSGDYIVHHGVRGTVATSIKSGGAAGDKICYIAYNADDWYVSTYGTWAQ